MEACICLFSRSGLDKHGPDHPESDPASAGPHIHGSAAGGVSLHQSADLSCNRAARAAGGARVAGQSGTRLWHHPVMNSPRSHLRHVLYCSLNFANFFIIVLIDLCVIPIPFCECSSGRHVFRISIFISISKRLQHLHVPYVDLCFLSLSSNTLKFKPVLKILIS